MPIFEKGTKTKSDKTDDESEFNEPAKFDTDNKQVQAVDSTTTAIGKNSSMDGELKKEIFSLPSAPSKGISSTAISCQNKIIQIKITDGKYKLDENDYKDVIKQHFISALNKAGFKPVYEVKEFTPDKKVFKLIHTDYALDSENFTGDYHIVVQGNKKIIKVKNGIALTDNTLIRDILISQGFTLGA